MQAISVEQVLARVALALKEKGQAMTRSLAPANGSIE
jgi:hypothetical protein